MSEVSIDPDRLWSSIMSLGEIGDVGDGAMMRVTGSEADARARDTVVAWFEDEGLDVSIDRVGNIIARREGANALPPVRAGSHLDTVPRGGKFDGTVGVLTPLEVVRAWNEVGLETDRPLELVVFTEEEGTRFGTGLLGSQVAAGRLPVERALQLKDEEGNTLEDVLESIGYLGNDDPDLSDGAAFVEVHVEQARTLDDAGDQLGIVDAITGICHLEVTLRGEANHAGATSMDERRDAFAGLAAVAVKLERRARELGTTSEAVGTIGKVDVEPGGANVIPERVRFTVDIRDTDERTRRTLKAFAIETLESVADDRGLDLDVTELMDVEAMPMDEAASEPFLEVCETLDVDHRVMASGAAHDAMNMATVVPTATLFVPSRDGISHSPAEYTEPDDVAAGAAVLKRGLRSLTYDGYTGF